MILKPKYTPNDSSNYYLMFTSLQASPAALAALRDAVESAVSDNVGVSTPTVDVFVRENLFPTAVSASRERLAVAASSKNGLVAWGNTNTQVSEEEGFRFRFRRDMSQDG